MRAAPQPPPEPAARRFEPLSDLTPALSVDEPERARPERSHAAAPCAPRPATARPAELAPITSVEQLAGPGRVIELSGRLGAGKRSTLVAMLAACQRRGEPCAVLELQPGTLYPPDLARSGLDLDALIVVQIPRPAPRSAPAGPLDPLALMVRAAELLLACGGFGLLALELGALASTRGAGAWLARLAGLARQRQACVVLMSASEPQAPSLGPLVGARVEPRLVEHGPGRYQLALSVLRNKLGAPCSLEPRVYWAPWELED